MGAGMGSDVLWVGSGGGEFGFPSQPCPSLPLEPGQVTASLSLFLFVKRGNSELWGLAGRCGGDGRDEELRKEVLLPPPSLAPHSLSSPSLFAGLSLQFSLKRAPTTPSPHPHTSPHHRPMQSAR